MTRIAVFIDYQNTYMGARRAFGLGNGGFVDGQIYPKRLGVAVTELGRDVDSTRTLQAVHVFRGEPSSIHSPKGLAACQRQVRFWDAQDLVSPTTRPLKYYPKERDARGHVTQWSAQEKGIDVLIALSMVTGATADDYDVAVLMSADTDLIPALEQVLDAGKRVEVAAWKGAGYQSNLALPTKKIWCHWLDRDAYNKLHDPTDYTVHQPNAPSSNP
jgi:uncharacterized LabA/DUF88 family protein